jgi:hypothetical protein
MNHRKRAQILSMGGSENCWILSKEEKNSTEAHYYFIHPDDGSVLAKWETTVAEDPNFKIHDDTELLPKSRYSIRNVL